MSKSGPQESLRSAFYASLVAVTGGLLFGGLTSYGQTVLPPQLISFANSAGGWTMLAFVLIWIGRSRIPLAAVLGVVTFESRVEGYAAARTGGVTSTRRPFPGSSP